VSDNKEYYKKYFLLPLIKVEKLLNFIVETTYLSANDLQIITKILVTENVRNLAEHFRATDCVSCEKYVDIINEKITQYVSETYFKNICNDESVYIEHEELCNSFTYDGSYFFHPVTRSLAARRIKVDVTFYDKKVHDIFKLRDGKVYADLQEIVQEVS